MACEGVADGGVENALVHGFSGFGYRAQHSLRLANLLRHFLWLYMAYLYAAGRKRVKRVWGPE